MRNVVLIISIVALLASAVACAWVIKTAAQIISLVTAVDEQVDNLCAAGILPDEVCDYWADLRERVLSKWADTKAEFLEFVEGLLEGELDIPYLRTPITVKSTKIDPADIILAAEKMVAGGYLTTQEYNDLVTASGL